MAMKKVLLIINPVAGKQKIKRKLTEVISLMNRAEWSVTVAITQDSNDAKRVVKQQGKGKDLIVCCGGDGTLSQVADAINHYHYNVPIGYIPCGTTNDFATSMELALDVESACKQIINGSEHPRDLGIFNKKAFTYIACFGLFSDASYNADQSLKNVMGHVAYVLEGVKDIFDIKSNKIKLTLDDKVIEDDFIFGAIGNTVSIGGIVKFNKDDVSFNDGKIEALLIKSPKDLKEVNETIVALANGNYNTSCVSLHQVEKIKIESEQAIAYTLDGEFAGEHKEASICVKKDGITLVY